MAFRDLIDPAFNKDNDSELATVYKQLIPYAPKGQMPIVKRLLGGQIFAEFKDPNDD